MQSLSPLTNVAVISLGLGTDSGEANMVFFTLSSRLLTLYFCVSFPFQIILREDENTSFLFGFIIIWAFCVSGPKCEFFYWLY